jgi:hypothetical protein
MASAETAIFISHVNGDPDAEAVLKALVDEQHGLKHELGPDYDAYKLFWDREIRAAEDWRKNICWNLCACAGAVILVSKQAFEQNRPWVRHETFALTTIKNGARPELCIVPVYLQGVEPLFQTSKLFDVNDLQRYQAVRYPGDPGLDTLDKLVARIAECLAAKLPKRDTKPLTGLAAALLRGLKRLPSEALKAAANRLDSTADWSRDQAFLAKELAQAFVGADEVATLQAFRDLCEEAQDGLYLRPKHDVALTLGAMRLQEEHALPIMAEAVTPGDAGCGRALLLAHSDPNIVDLYLTRAARTHPHQWNLLRVDPVLEFGQSQDLKNCVSGLIAKKLGKAAGNNPEDQLKLAKATIPKLRKAGTPVLVNITYQLDADPVALFSTIRDISLDLMLLFSASPDTVLDLPSTSPVLALSGGPVHTDLSGTLNAMRIYIENTTPAEETPE